MHQNTKLNNDDPIQNTGSNLNQNHNNHNTYNNTNKKRLRLQSEQPVL